MRDPGSTRSRPKFLARLAQSTRMMMFACVASSSLHNMAGADELLAYTIVDDAIPVSLTGVSGDPVRGRAIILDRQNTCILCHGGPFPELKFSNDLAPDLTGVGSRWSESQLRLRLVDASRFNPTTIMPSYYRVDGLVRVAAAWRGKPILSAQQIEDLVAYLAALRDR